MNFDQNNKFCISAEEVVQIFFLALKRLIKVDMHLLKSGIHERSLQFKLACYLREYFIFAESGGLYIDVECNRKGMANIKENSNNARFFPDILLHERGSADYHNEEENRNNIIYCEIKKKSMSGNRDAKRICTSIVIT